MSLLECKNLTKRYAETTALDSVSLSLDGGKIVGLLGPNGSGKTTFIKIATGTLKQTSGEMKILDNDVSVESKKNVAYLPDRECLPEYMTVHDLCEFYKSFYDDFSQKKADLMLDSLNIPRKTPIKKMSKGTREKVLLILVMSRDAKIYFLDEPIAGVDPAARDYILKTIISNYCKDSLVIISTHLIADIENVLDEVVFIKDGCIILKKSVDEIREQNAQSVDELFREVFKC